MDRCRIDIEQPDGCDLRVAARPGTTVAEILRTAEGATTPMEDARHVGGTVVTDDSVVGVPPLLDGARLRRGSPPPAVPLELLVVAGPSTGRRCPLGSRPVVVGRDDGSDLRLADPAASRTHAVVEVVDGTPIVRDAVTTNGTTVDDEPAGAREVPCTPGTRIGVGGSALTVCRTAPPRRSATTAGTTIVRPSRSRADTTAPVAESLPPPLREATARRLDPVVLLAPLVASAAMALALHSPLLLLLGLVGPVITLSTTLGDRRAGRRTSAKERRAHATATARAHEVVARAAVAEAERRRATAHDTARAIATAEGDGAWSADDVRWCPGRGSLPAQHVTLDGAPPQLADVPLVVRLEPGDRVAIGGDGARACARALVAQLVTSLPPDRLALGVLTDDRTLLREWAWTSLLPHRRTGPADGSSDSPQVLLVVDGTTEPPPSQAIVVYVGEDTSARWRLHTGTGPGGSLLDGPDGTTALTADGLDLDAADRLARALAPLRPAGGSATDLPDAVALCDLLDPDLGPSALAPRWAARRRLGPVPVGIGLRGTVSIDLVRDGPHALVGGTTGAGKSELVTTLVTSLALTHPPDVVSVLLIDFKGGATGSALAALPHVCDVVTDLDPGATQRALTGLEAELKRRERLLAEQGVTEVDECPGLPRLVIVVDEYRVLAEEHPAFLAGLLRVATTGRSLGVHLLLATQRPAGIVSADIRANVALRIALRVNDSHDSVDVVGSPVAARLPSSTPGRAVVRRADGDLDVVQMALAGAPPQRDEPAVILVGRPDASASRDGLLPMLVEAAQQAAVILGLERAASPVPRPLPETVDGESLLGRHVSAEDGGLPLGIVDLPHEQRHEVLTHDPEQDGHLGIVGVARSGRTTTARQLVVAALAASAGWVVQTVGGPELTAGIRSPRLASTLPPSDTRLVLRLLDRVRGTPGAPTVVVIDGWQTVTAGTDPLTALRLHDALTRLLAEGPGRDVRVVVTGDRSLLAGSVGSHVTERLVLRLADGTDLALTGLSTALASAWTSPGRALRARDGAVVQIARSPGEWQDLDAGAPMAVPRLRPLPARVALPPGTCAIGLGGDEAQPVELDVAAQHTVLVVGAPGSGRRTTLDTLARSGASPVVLVGRSAFRDLACVAHVDPAAPEAALQLAAAIRRHPGAVVIVPDLADVTDGPLDAELVRLAEQRVAPVVAAATPEQVAGAYRGLAGLMRRHRTGIILGPSAPADGEPLGVRLDGFDSPAPGRGVLVVAGRQTVVQVAVIETDETRTAPDISGPGSHGGTMGP